MAPPKGATAARGQEAGGVKGLESIFSGMKLEGATDEYHPRPDFGKAGKPIPVVANMYKVRFKNQGKEANSVNHYDVEINPVVKVANQKKPKQMLWEIWNQACAEATGEVKKVLDSAAYDSVKNMYTPYGLPTDGPNGNFEIIVALKEAGGDKAEKGDKGNDDRRRFKIVFSLANVIDLNTITEFCSKVPQTEKTKEIVLVAIQAMNVLLRQDPTNRFKAVGAQGRRFFSTEGAQPIPLGGVVYNGFMQSFRFTNSGSPAVQLDTAYSAFVQPGNLITVASGLLGAGGGGGARGGRGGPRGSPPDRGGRGGARGGRGGPPGAGGDGGGGDLNTLNPSQVGKLNRILRMAKFKVNHRPSERIFTLRGLTTRPCSELKFNLQGRDGAADRMVPVVQYMKEMYNYTVRKPNLPAVQYGKNFYLPMECAEIIDFNSIPFAQIASDQAAAMITIAAKAPPERRKTIEQWRGKLAYEKLPKIKAWGVEVVNEMMKVQARVLQPPNVVYGGNGRARVQFGGWNLKGTKFTRPGQPLKCWAVLSFDKFVGVPMLQGFVGQLVSVLNGAGCPVVNQQPPLSQMNPHPNGPCSGVKIAIQEACKAAYLQSKMDPQLLIIILPGKEAMMYQTIKQIAAETLQKPLVTQCLQAAKIKSDRGIDQYLGNVSMKIHAKLGGVTHEVPLPQIIDKKTMIIGADVTHPPARGGALPPSIAVTVAATNGDNVRFIPSIRLQEGRVEIISDLANMFHAQLLAFQRNSKALPEKIIMFRDGVSEGQYAHCVQEELKSMKDAAAKFPNYRPKFTFVVCAKRHNMRFFAEHQADIDRTGNLPPGTVVDNGVTHPFAFDFYLQAHAGLQGTARPTHYICVADENGFTADKLQGLCNALSYTYARATRSVSLIPVAYYADIIATKARDFVYGEDDSDAVSIATGSSGPEQRMTFNPTRLSSRFDNTSFNQVAWYM